MVEVSRRTMLAGAGFALASATAGGAALYATSGSAPKLERASTHQEDRSPGTVPITELDDPVRIASLAPTTSANVMQQVELTGSGTFYMTQARTGETPGFDSIVITRCSSSATSDGVHAELDAMTIVDGGHGLGLHVERGLGADLIWTSLSVDSGWAPTTGGRLARFRYTPGVYAVDAIPGGVRFAPRFPNRYGELQPSAYSFDWTKGQAVEWMFDPRDGHHDHYTRRRIVDIVAGRDRPLDRLTLPTNPPTLQGFATINATLFRWGGAGNGGSGESVADNPMVLDQWNWRSGSLIARKVFPTLGQDDTGSWRDGAYEPEGCSVFREPDGTASLVLGVTTGLLTGHEWGVYKFPSVGAP